MKEGIPSSISATDLKTRGDAMLKSKKVLIPCSIERGGFGNERTYRVQIHGGGEHVGLAPWIYCFDKVRKPVDNEPEEGVVVKGFVVGRFISNGGDSAKIAF